MRNSLIDFVAAAAIAAAMTAVPATAHAQLMLQQQEATVASGTIVAPAGAPSTFAATGAPSPFAAATVRTYTYEPVCIVRRVQFSDEWGWRVRDVRICY
jgi:hypothetical protein